MQNEFGSGSTGSVGMGGTSGGHSGQGGKSGAEDTMDQAKAKAQQLAGDVQQRATEQVQSRLSSQKQHAAQSLSGLAETLRSTGQQLQQNQTGGSQYVHQVADRVEDLARFLEQRDVGEIIDEVEDYARHQPAVFLGAAFALGVLGARFLKSSRRNLASEGLREHWTTREMTNRVRDPELDAVGRPRAPGYAPPSERAGDEHRAAGPRK